MSTELSAYAMTKKNTPIPAGWMLVEPENCNPAETVVQFWNPGIQGWEALTMDGGAPPASFVGPWSAGQSCLIVKDPNYVAPPPVAAAPAFPMFGGAAVAPPFAAPAAFAPPPAAVPVAAPAPAPVVSIPVPVAVPMIPVQAAPVVPVFTPAPVQAAPVVLPTEATPAFVPPTLPSVPQAFTAPVAEAEDRAQISAADPNEVSAWLAAREGVKAQLDALEKVESEIRKRIVKTCFPDGLREGTNKCTLPDGRILTITGKVNRTVDTGLVPTALGALQQKNGTAPSGLFRTKYELDMRVFKALDVSDKALLANCITEKEGSLQLAVSEPK